MIFRHPGGRKTESGWYPPGTPVLAGRPFRGPEVDEFLRNTDVVLFFESPMDWSFLGLCRERGVKTAILVMSEWWPERPPVLPDIILSPSVWDQQYFPGSPFLQVPVDPSTWRLRTHARRWLMNAGWVGARGHKGALEVLKALRLCRTPVDFTFRAQRGVGGLLQEAGWPGTLDRHPLPGGGTLTVRRDEGDRETLYSDHDVFVMAEKFNGLSLPLQEARAAGMLVMTTRRPPATDWLPQDPLIPVAGMHKARVAPGYLEIDECDVDPAAIAARIDDYNGRDITEYSRGGLEWAKANSWEALKPAWQAALEAACEK